MCRYEEVCAECTGGCSPPGVSIDNEYVPICTAVPPGVNGNATGQILSSLDLKKGYFRISNNSHVVLECYQVDACRGGTNATEYCADGYEGPCERIL